MNSQQDLSGDPSTIQVAIVDDHPAVRAGLRELFSQTDDIRVAAEAASARAASDMLRHVEVDVLILDLMMPGQTGLEAITSLRAKAPGTAFLAFSGQAAAPFAVNMLRLGAMGYLGKECDPLEILKAVRMLAAGRWYITPAVAELMASAIAPAETTSQGFRPHQLLTPRELHFFLRFARGEETAAVAHALSLSTTTIFKARTQIMRKLKLSTNSQLTSYALKHGLLD